MDKRHTSGKARRRRNAAPGQGAKRSSRAASPAGRRRRWLLFAGGAIMAAVGLLADAPLLWSAREASGRAVGPSRAEAAPSSSVPPETPVPAGEPSEPAPKPDTPPQMTVAMLKERALEVARRVVADFPDDPDAMDLMAKVHEFARHTEEAETWWRKCLQRAPGHAGAYHGLGKVALARGQNEKAAELWRKSQQANPKLPGVYRSYAIALLRLGRPEEAVDALGKEMTVSPPAEREDHVLLGQAYLQLRQYEKAAENYEKALQLRPDDPTTCYGLAAAYARLGRKDKAADYRARFKELEAKQDRTYGMRDRSADQRSWAVHNLVRTCAGAGHIYRVHGRRQEAEEHWRRGARLSPTNQPCRQQLVDLYVQSGRLRDALGVCRRLCQIDPANPAYHWNAGFVLSRLHQFAAAQEAVWKGIRLAPSQPAGYRALVQVLLASNANLSRAGAAARKLVELEPTAGNLVLLSEVCYRRGDLAGARAALKRALDLDPDNETIGQAYERLRPWK